MSAGSLTALSLADLSIGLREVLVGLIVLIVAYAGFVAWRMQRLQRRAVPSWDVQAAPAVPPMADAPPAPAVPSDDAPAWPAPDIEPAPAFDPGMTQELMQLRDEVDALRGELAALRNDMQQEIAHLRAAQTVSPLYGDAMQMAVAGFDAVRIAERCGIARAEAELVVALASSQRTRQDPDSEGPLR